MTYNAVPTVTVGEMLEPTWWDDNIATNDSHFADDHDHGSADHGALTLGGSGGMTSNRFADGSDPSAPGAGKTVFYSKSGKMFQRAGAAGSPEQFSIVGHTH